MTRPLKLGFYATPPHECNYLPDRTAITLFADPRFPKNNRLYSALADCGFRRSGEHVYIPHCNECHACIPVRIPVAAFRPTRGQLRTRRRNADVSVRAVDAIFDQRHFDLYCRYVKHRHAGGGMDSPTQDTYMEFLTSSWSDTTFYEFSIGERLLAVSVADQMHDALSAVYTFFDPLEARRSPGRLAILHLVDEARYLDRQWIYLGYWIKSCRKMSYKIEYQPLEYFYANAWHDELPADSTPGLLPDPAI